MTRFVPPNAERRRRLVLPAGLVFAVALALGATPVEASPGASCEHAGECSKGEACVADSPTSDHGHCVRIRVLPRDETTENPSVDACGGDAPTRAPVEAGTPGREAEHPTPACAGDGWPVWHSVGRTMLAPPTTKGGA